MKITTQAPAVTETVVEVKEEYSTQDGKPCIDFIVGGYLVAKQVTEMQSVGTSFRLINKLYTLAEPVEYTTAEAVDVSGISPEVLASQSFISVIVPPKNKDLKKAVKPEG